VQGTKKTGWIGGQEQSNPPPTRTAFPHCAANSAPTANFIHRAISPRSPPQARAGATPTPSPSPPTRFHPSARVPKS